MADKSISTLPGVSSIDNDSLFVAEQQGVAHKVSGAQIASFAKEAANANVQAAVDAAKSAAASANRAEEKANMAEGVALYPPKVNPESGFWMIWDSATKQYTDTSWKAEGPAGPPGPAGTGTGDMLASVYDPSGKAKDIFAYVDTSIEVAIGNAIGGSY